MQLRTSPGPEGTVGTTVPITEIRNIPSHRGTSLYHGTSLYRRSYLLVPRYRGTVPVGTSKYRYQVLVGRVLVSRLPGIRLG